MIYNKIKALRQKAIKIQSKYREYNKRIKMLNLIIKSDIIQS